MHNGVGWEYLLDSFSVFKPSYLFGKRGQVKRWEYKSKKHMGKGYSDHLPIYAIFSTNTTAKKPDEIGFFAVIGALFSFCKDEKQVSELSLPKIKIEVPKKGKIEEIIKMDRLDVPMVLKNIKVIFKRGDTAVIKQEHNGRAILLYRCAGELKEGGVYNITAYQKKRYKGLDEIVDIALNMESGKVDGSLYVMPFSAKLMQSSVYINEVVSDIDGILKKSKIEIDGESFPVYFKKQAKRPPVGTHIRISRAQIGYYKNHIQLVVWDRKDYKIVE